MHKSGFARVKRAINSEDSRIVRTLGFYHEITKVGTRGFASRYEVLQAAEKAVSVAREEGVQDIAESVKASRAANRKETLREIIAGGATVALCFAYAMIDRHGASAGKEIGAWLGEATVIASAMYVMFEEAFVRPGIRKCAKVLAELQGLEKRLAEKW
ncbi:MAG: hypothetical protein NT051_01065 [Candidatus Micrarchaeota archaeon]|nr:hypothetical protein [Candidatus Micrarchaeota archaeon]